MWRYADFLYVREDFIPVFSEEVDQNHRANWKSFIPHVQMRNLLEKLIIALERAHGGDKRSLWLTGAYGTGKTMACFVIKHLLEDDPAVIEDYFGKHQLLQSLRPRLVALRENNRYVVVYRSGAGHITSSRRLMIEVQQAIKSQLAARGLANAFSPTLMEQLVKRLTDESGILNWGAAFRRHRGRFLAAATAEEVIDGLLAGDTRLGEAVADVLEDEGLALIDSPAAVKAWIKEVISANSLQGIVFIWDEFTEFFTKDVPVTPLQELAHATADMPFYLFLVTHRAPSQFTRIDEDTRKKLLDRFHNCQLEMNPVTAYQLVGNVIEVRPDYRHDWESKLESLWAGVDRVALHINVLGEQVRKDDLKRMVPVHPFTAFLLATISRHYSSSQRTLFQFLKTDAPGSFQQFINEYPQEKRFWLTPDFLWQYFFEEDPKIEGLEAISDLLSHYRSAKDRLNEQERAVLRATLLLIAMWRQTQGALELLKPALSVLKSMFVGTALHETLDAAAQGLCDRGVLLAVLAGDDKEYIIPTAAVDHAKLKAYQIKAAHDLTFEKMLTATAQEGGFGLDPHRLLSLQGAAKVRHPVEVVAAGALKTKRERLLRRPVKPYEIGLLLVFAEEDGHLVKSEELAAEMSVTHGDWCIVVGQTPFGGRRWHEWLDGQAHSWYYKEMRDGGTQKYYDTRTKNLESEWLDAVRSSRLRAFYQGRKVELTGCNAVAPYLREIVRSVFRHGPEELVETATLYDHAWGKSGAEIGLRATTNVSQPYKSVVSVLEKQGLWDDEEARRRSHTSTGEMQRVVDGAFAAREPVNLRELWEKLQQPPYGLMPSPIGILLFAFLLRPYANRYYYSDGTNSLPLNPNKLAELVHQVMKELKGSENYTIRKMSEEGEQFCRMAAEVFQLGEAKVAFPEEARKNMRETLRNIGFPIWAVVPLSADPAAMKAAVEALQKTLGYERGDLTDRDMQAVVEAVRPGRPQQLIRMLNTERMQEGMRRFWEAQAPELVSLMTTLNLSTQQVMARLRALLNEDVYLWTEERVKSRLPEVIREFDLVYALNTLCGARKQELEDVRRHFRDTWFKGKLPLICFKDGQQAEIADLVDYLHSLIYRAGEGLQDNRAPDIRKLSGELAALFAAGPSVLRTLVTRYTGQGFPDEEAAALFAVLPDLSGATEEDARRAISERLSQQARQRKIATLEESWRQLTRSGSPMDWSEQAGTPIQWVMDGSKHHDFFSGYANLRHLPDPSIEKLALHLDEHTKELAVLNDAQHVLDRFVQVAAGDYADLVRQTGMGAQLRQHVRERMKDNVYHWPARLHEIQEHVRSRLTAGYRETAYPHVLKTLHTVAPADMKHLLRELAADPLVGARLLAMIRSRAET